MKLTNNRRQFITTTLLTGTSASILPTTSLGLSNQKLNIALIGAHGRAKMHYHDLKTQNVTALCDVNAHNLALAKAEFPNAKTYEDWRDCLDHPGLDAIVCCTTDHTHAFISIWAMNRGLHVFCEKPVAECVHEARLVRQTYLKNRHRLATQHGTQRHAHPNFDRLSEMIRNGAIGELKDVHTWGNRTHQITGYPTANGTPPAHINYDLWLGPAPYHPYNPEYFSGAPGANCLQWNVYHDFGSWQVGDMGSHTMDLAWNALDADCPTQIAAKGDAYHPEVCPSTLSCRFDIPANDWRDAIRLTWNQGGPRPNSPSKAIDLQSIGHGALFKGTEGIIVADFRNRFLIPMGDHADLSRFTPPTPRPPIGGFMQQWFTACKTNLKTDCDFDYAGKMIETLMLGLVAHRAGKTLNYNAQNGTITNHKEANAFLKKTYRNGWTLNG